MNKVWRDNNPERVKQLGKEWYEKNPERVKEYAKNRAPPSPESRKKWQRAAKARDPELFLAKRRVIQSVYRHGLTPSQKADMLTAQGGVCAVCAASAPGGKNWHTDHCHATGKIRGILCHHCNVALGHVKDSPAILRKLAAYLEDHGEATHGPTPLAQVQRRR